MNIEQELNDLILKALRSGLQIEQIAQALTQQFERLQAARPIIQAIHEGHRAP